MRTWCEVRSFASQKFRLTRDSKFFKQERSRSLCGGMEMASHANKWSPLHGAHK